MRKLVSIGLLVGMVSPFWVVFFAIQVQKAQLRREVKHMLMATEPDSSFVHLAFTHDETQTLLRWEHHREFEYKGEMYDVVRRETRNDSVFFTLWWDHEETALNQKLDLLLSEKSVNDTKAKYRDLLRCFTVFPPSGENGRIIAHISTETYITFVLTPAYDPIQPDIPYPPPQAFSAH